MRAYAIRRILLIIPTIFIVTIMVFFSVRFIPGDVIDLMVTEMAQESGMGSELTAETIRHSLGLDENVFTQYGRWLGVLPQRDTAEGESRFRGAFQGNFGESLWTGRSVRDDIFSRYPISMELGIIAVITAMIIALPIGVYSAIRQDTLGDYAGRTFAILSISIPSFWMATIVVVYPAIWWNWTPPVQYIPFLDNPIENLKQFFLPAIIMGMHMAGGTMRMTRTMMLEVLRQDYIRTAWAKGLNERTVILRHALKNAFIPIITIVGPMILVLIGGSVIMEQIFCLPGLGRLFIEALNKRDYVVISGMNTITATGIVFINLAVDLSYAWFDPRIQYR